MPAVRPRELQSYRESPYPSFAQPQPKPPPAYPLPHPQHSQQEQRRKQLEAYHARNHGKFREQNRGSKKAGFLGMLVLLLKCGSVADDVDGVVN